MLKNKTIRVQTAERAAPNPKRPNLPGNLRINGQWFSSIEWRNQLLSQELPTETPIACLLGATLSYKELTVTAEMLEAGGGVHTEIVNGREVKYSRVGVNNIELRIDFSTLNLNNSVMKMAELKAMFPNARRVQQPAPAAQSAPAAMVVDPGTADQTVIDEEGTVLEEETAALQQAAALNTPETIVE